MTWHIGDNAGHGAPTNGVTGKNKAEPGSFYVDLDNGNAYANTGTKSAPVWSAVGGGGVTDPLDIGVINADEVNVGGNPLTPSGIQYVDVQLTNDQILNLKTSPVLVVSSPGVGLGLVVHEVYVVLDTRLGVYANDIGGSSQFVHPNGGSLTSSLLLEKENLIDYTVAALQNRVVTVDRFNDPVDNGFWNVVDDEGLWFGKAQAEFTGGHADNTLSLRIWYGIVPTVPFGA